MTTKITIVAEKAKFPGNLADELGALQARIAELRNEEAKLKGALIATGEARVEGNFYAASISELADSTPIDYKAAFLALVPKTRQALAAGYTSFRAGGFRVAVRARKSSAVQIRKEAA